MIVSGLDERNVDDVTNMLARTAPYGEGILTLGPAPAPMALLRGRHRRRLLLKVDKGISIQKVLRAWLEPLKIPSNVRVQVDVDPYSFL